LLNRRDAEAQRKNFSSADFADKKTMGAFYGNITLKGPSQADVAKALRGRRAIVTPKVGDYTVAFDSVCDEQNVDGIQAVTSRLSRELRCPALTVIVHDDDVLGYFLYREGELGDWYNSCPSYFDFGSKEEPAAPKGGNAEQLCKVFGAGKPQALETMLRKRPGEGGYVFETERHRDLVSALLLPKCTVGTAFESFERGEYPDGLSPDSMMRVAGPPPVEDRQRRLDREFYEKLGPEDLSRPCKKEDCQRGAIPNSVLCKRHHFEMIQRRDCPFD
jgi:hypothetical protein